MSRFTLLLKAYLFRTIKAIFLYLDLNFSYPIPQRESFTRKITTKISSIPGSIKLLFYTPPSYTKRTSPTSTSGKHPLLVNFHGGGFTIGNAGDDARWATTIITQTPAVVVSVGYRLAPKYPFPIGIEDCVSAVLWLWEHADEYNLDISLTAFSGFSAGGNLCYTVAIRLHEEIERLKREGKLEKLGIEKGKVVNLAVFYGSCDWTISRDAKDASNPNLIPNVPKVLFRMIDEAYPFPKPDMRNPLLSPGLADDELLRRAFPDRLVLINCGGDQLLAEEEKFRERLKGLGKTVDGLVVEGVGHAWDKQPTFRKGDGKRDEAYAVAVKSLLEVWT